MKKFKKSFLIILPLILTTFVTPNQTEAATSSWQNVSGISGCQVRVWTDATTYYQGASTVDWYAQSNRQCGTLEYLASIEPENTIQWHTGYFSSQTPTKSFELSSSYWPSSRSGNVVVELYKNDRKLDEIKSTSLYIYAQ